MNDYQPKVGDRVMVGEHGPYVVHRVAPVGLYRDGDALFAQRGES